MSSEYERLMSLLDGTFGRLNGAISDMRKEVREIFAKEMRRQDEISHDINHRDCKKKLCTECPLWDDDGWICTYNFPCPEDINVILEMEANPPE